MKKQRKIIHKISNKFKNTEQAKYQPLKSGQNQDEQAKYKQLKSEQKKKIETFFQHIASNASVDFTSQEIQDFQNAVGEMLERIRTRVNPLVTNRLSRPYHLDDSTFNFRGIESDFSFFIIFR